MPGLNISRAEARERSAHLSVASYVVTIDVCHGPENFIAKSTVKFACNKPGYDTFVDAVGKRIISAKLNGKVIDVSNFDGESVYLKGLAADNELVIEIEGDYSKTGKVSNIRLTRPTMKFICIPKERLHTFARCIHALINQI